MRWVAQTPTATFERESQHFGQQKSQCPGQRKFHGATQRISTGAAKNERGIIIKMANRGPGRNVVCIGRYAWNEIDSNNGNATAVGNESPSTLVGEGLGNCRYFEERSLRAKMKLQRKLTDGLQAMWVARRCQEIGSIHFDDQRNPVSTYKN